MDLLTTSKENSVLVVQPSDRIDGTNARDFEAEFMQHIHAGEDRILVDFSGVDFISSAGLRVLLMVAKELKAKSGRIELCSMRAYLKEVFEVSGFDAIFPIHEARADGLAAFTDS